MATQTDHDARSTTAESLLEQIINTESSIANARRVQGGGYEATTLAGLVYEAWSPAEEVIHEIVGRALDLALDAGSTQTIASARAALARRALLTREACRDEVVLPLLEPAQRRIVDAIASAVARIDVRNAERTCEGIIQDCYGAVDELREQIRAGLRDRHREGALHEQLEAALLEAEAPLTSLIAALRELEASAGEEPTRITADLDASRTAAAAQYEAVRIACGETQSLGLFGLFGGGRAVRNVVRTVSTVVPSLGDERVAQIYLPMVRDALPAIARACREFSERLSTRRSAVEQARRELGGVAAQSCRTQSPSGRLRVVGAPSEAARLARTRDLVDSVLASVGRELRDLIVFRAPPQSLLAVLLDTVRARVDALVPTPSLDDALLRDRSPREVALQLDREIRSAVLPVTLVGGADRHWLAEHQCRVLRIAPGSRVAQALIREVGYKPGAFSFAGTPDRLEILLWSPGVSITETRLLHGGRMAWTAETTDPRCSPVTCLAEDVLAAPAADTVKETTHTRSSTRRARIGTEPVAPTTSNGRSNHGLGES